MARRRWRTKWNTEAIGASTEAAGLCLGFQNITLILQTSLSQCPQKPLIIAPTPHTQYFGTLHCSNHAVQFVLGARLLVNVTMISFFRVPEHVRSQGPRQVARDATLVLDIKRPFHVKRVCLSFRHNDRQQRPGADDVKCKQDGLAGSAACRG